MKLIVMLDFEDGTGPQRRDAQINPLTDPSDLWWHIRKCVIECIRNAMFKKHGDNWRKESYRWELRDGIIPLSEDQLLTEHLYRRPGRIIPVNGPSEEKPIAEQPPTGEDATGA